MGNEPEVGTQNLKECVVAANEISVFLISRLRDGVDLSDAAALVQKLISDAEFKAVIEAAVKDIGQVKGEVKDLSLAEGLALAEVQLSYVPKIVAALKG